MQDDGSVARPMPASYYEHLSTARPHILKEVDRLAAVAGDAGIGPHFQTLDDLGTTFHDVMRAEILAQARLVAPQMRRSVNEVAQHIVDDPQTRRAVSTLADMDLSLLLRHRLSGMAIYRLTDGISSRLAETRLNMPTELMRLPYPTIMLVLDDPWSIASYEAMHGDGKGIRKGAITVFVEEYPEGMHPGEPRKWKITAKRTHNDKVGLQIGRTLDCSPGHDAEAALRTDWGARGIFNERMAEMSRMAGSRVSAPDDAIHYTVGLAFYRIVLNAIFYVTSHRPSVSAPRRNPGRLASDRVSFSGRTHIVMGEGMTILDRTPSSSPGDGTRAGRTLEGMQRVSGHWKVQAHGAGMALRKTIFVDPYYRGNDAAELVVRAAAVR